MVCGARCGGRGVGRRQCNSIRFGWSVDNIFYALASQGKGLALFVFMFHDDNDTASEPGERGWQCLETAPRIPS